MKRFLLGLFMFLIGIYVNAGNKVGNNTDISGELWFDLFNYQIENIENAYTENAFVLLADGTVLQGKAAISDFYQSFRTEYGMISSSWLIAQKEVSNAKNVEYEIGSFTSDNDKVFKHLVVFEEVGGQKLRHFETIAEQSTDPANTDLFEQRRIDWANGANSHNVAGFIENLYTKNAVYYYHSGNELSIGNAEITEAYQYMADPSFKIDKLTAIHTEPVNSKLVFEIGTWSMPGAEGEYVIVWQLCSDNVWKILFDSNY